MDRHWLLTWTCYGTWLPGATKGFIGNVRDVDGGHITHNIPGTPVDADIPGLGNHVREKMRAVPVVLDEQDALALIAQYQETARIRQWTLQAASVMYNHTHVVVSVPGDPHPALMIETLKSWATRALKNHRSVPSNEMFWTAKGSKRKLDDDNAVVAAVVYAVKKQPNPLAVYYAPMWQDVLDAFVSEEN